MRLHWARIGALINQVYLEGDFPAYEKFLHYELEIDFKKAIRLRKAYLAFTAAGLSVTDMRGISVSHTLALRPILESYFERQRTDVAEWLGRARCLSVLELKQKVLEHLRGPRKGPPSPKIA